MYFFKFNRKFKIKISNRRQNKRKEKKNHREKIQTSRMDPITKIIKQQLYTWELLTGIYILNTDEKRIFNFIILFFLYCILKISFLIKDSIVSIV